MMGARLTPFSTKTSVPAGATSAATEGASETKHPTKAASATADMASLSISFHDLPRKKQALGVQGQVGGHGHQPQFSSAAPGTGSP